MARLRARWLLGLCLVVAAPERARTEPPDGKTKHPPEQCKLVRTDRYGDPLPDFARARLGTIRFRHQGGVCSVAVSPDGKLLASGSHDFTVHLWEAATGKEVRRLDGTLAFRCVAFSPDGKLLAGGGDQSIHLWGVGTGKQIRELLGHEGQINRIAFFPDGKMIASAGDDKTVRLWETETGKELRQFKGHEGSVGSVAFSPDGKLLASGAQHLTVRLWDVATGKQVRRLPLGKGDPREGVYVAAAFCPLNLCAVAHTLWLRDSAFFAAAAFPPDSKTLATACNWYDWTSQEWKGRIRFWDVGSGKELRKLRENAKGVSLPVFSRDGKVVAASVDGRCRFWEPATGKSIPAVGSFQTTDIWPGALSPDGQILISADGHAIRLWQVTTGQELPCFGGHHSSVTCLGFSPDGKTLASGSKDGTVRVWDTAGGREIRQFRDGRTGVQCVVFSPDGKVLASGDEGDHGIIRLREVSTGKVLRQIDAEGPTIYSAGFSLDGRSIAANDGQSVRLWDTATGKEIRKLCEGDDTIPLVRFSLDGKTVVAGDRLLEVATGKEIRRFGGQHDGFVYMALSPDGKHLALADGNDLYVWEVATGRECLRLADFAGRFLAFSPDGRTLAAKDFDSEFIELWEITSGRQRLALLGQSSFESAPLCFSPDGRTLASGSDDTTIMLWDVTTTGLDKEGRLVQVRLAPKDLEDAWQALASEHAIEADVWSWRFAAAAEQALPFLRKRLRSPAPLKEEPIARLVADLDSPQLRVRQKAGDALEKLGEAAEPALRKALAGKPSLEVRRRVERLLKLLEGPVPSGARLRRLRAVEVLERIGTPEAREVLQMLAKGAPEARLTQEAKASLERLAKRGTSRAD